MQPAGYLAKRVAQKPAWLPADRVSSIFSVSGCISSDFADYIRFWKHNGYWLFDSPEIIVHLAREHDIELAGTDLFFYEVFELQYEVFQLQDEGADLQFQSGEWMPFQPEASFATNVCVPEARVLEGYDVVTFDLQTSPQCSPLSCNSLASRVETNSRCLLESFEQARKLLEGGAFNHSEPGPYRVFAVYSVAWPAAT